MTSTVQSIELLKHLKAEHKASPLQTYLKEIVYGGNDGIITTFAVVAGFSGANLGGGIAEFSFLTVLLFGLANLVADGASMGLGNFLSLRSEQDLYRAEQAKERHEIRTNPSMERKESLEILQAKGFTKSQATQLTDIYEKNEDYYVQFMMNYELEMANPLSENPLLTGLATFFAFIAFGFIPLIPYILIGDSPNAFSYSLLATFSALILLGLLRWFVTGEKLLRSVFEIVLIGSVAASLAYFVGTLFKG
jgi:VIT1/CCC1 family predicted Fe2+/Mn2+ transporter